MWLLHHLSWKIKLKWAFLTPVVRLSVLFTIRPFTKVIQLHVYHETFVCLFVCCCFVLYVLFCLSVCLSLPVKIENIHSYGDVTTTGWGVQSLTYARHSWPLSTEGSLACHTYWDTGHPFIMAISEDPWNSHLLPSVWQWSCHYLFIRLRNVGARIRTPNRALGGLTNICVSHFYFLQVL